MNYFRRSDLTTEVIGLLTRYDETIRRFVGPGYRHPIRMRDWELARILVAIRSVPVGSSVLDTGSYNTYLALALGAAGYRSGAPRRRVRRFFERRMILAASRAHPRVEPGRQAFPLTA